jgi:hypothetical protein
MTISLLSNYPGVKFISKKSKIVGMNFVESHFEANLTLVEPGFGRKEFGRISFTSIQDFGRIGL